MNANTARVLRNACLQVLSGVFPNEWETVEISSISSDEIFSRFQNLRGKSLTPRSLQDYRRRFLQALESFGSYVKDPASWKGPGQERVRNDSGGSERSRIRERGGKPGRMESTGDELIDYPFPLGEVTAHLFLPRNLRMLDARRLSSFVASLASDWETPNGWPLVAKSVNDR
jgi:hypothetical protein